MFRVMRIIVISMCFIGTAFADEGWRHFHPHKGYFGRYVQQQRGYYQPPHFNYSRHEQRMPIWGRRDRDGRW